MTTRQRIATLLHAALSLAACGHASHPPPSDHIEEIIDVADRCSVLPAECLDHFDRMDDDGCPDPSPISFVIRASDDSLPPEATGELGQVAIDAGQLREGVRLLVVVEGSERADGMARASVLYRGIERAGIPADSVDPEPRFVPGGGGIVRLELEGCARLN